LDTQFVATVIAVIEDGSIAAAARRTGLTAGAVAQRIRAVEAEVGTRLLERSGRRVVPTPAAGRLLAALRTLVTDAADLRRLAVDAGPAGELRLGTIASATTGLLPPLLRALGRTHPRLDVFIEPGTSPELCERVLDGALDAAVVVQPPFPLRKGEVFTRWVAEPLVLIVPPETPGDDPLELLRTQTFIRYDRRNWGGRIVDDYLRRTGAGVVDRFELDALDGIVAMVSAGLGVAIIPDWRGPHPRGTAVRRIALPGSPPDRVIGLYSRAQSPRQDLARVLTEAFQSQEP
jgi:DNA-binding transcriptional LysR family regulator